MSFQFPRFDEPTAIDAERSWTAVFDSYDQRNDDTYYVVTVHRPGGAAVRFMVQVWLGWAGDDWTTPDFVPRLQAALHQGAATGKPNTTYTGRLVPGPPDGP